MDELLKLLNASALNESDQESLKEKLEILIEAKAQEKVDVLVEDEKTRLVSEYEDKFETYKEDVFSKFSTFVDQILEEEMVIPEHIVEYARKGELYEDIIEQFKIRIAIDEDALDTETKEIISEAKEEIMSLRGQLDEAISENLDAKVLLTEAQAELHKNELCEGLTVTQKSKIMPLLEGINDIADLDKKFSKISEIFLTEAKEEEEKDEEDEEDGEDKKDKKDKKDCDADKDKKDMNESMLDGKGETEVTVVEDSNKSFFDKFLASQTQVLKNL